MRCYIVTTSAQLATVADWVLKQSATANPSLTLCWASHHKPNLDYVKTMLQKRLSNIAVAEDDSGNIKAIIYFEFRDEQDKVAEKWITYGSVVVDADDWKADRMEAFNAVLRFVYEYCHSQNVVKGDLWTLERIFKSHQTVLGDKFLTVLEDKPDLRYGRLIHFYIDVKAAMEAAKT